jgi:transcriptional regulator with XRE-family HTH domain
MGDKDDAPRNVIAERLEHLIATVHPASRGPYLLREIADGVNEAAGEKVVSVAYLSQLRLGQRMSPSFKILQAIAQWFGVPPSYFADDMTAAHADEQLEFLTAMRDAGVRSVALRAQGLSEQALEAVRAVIDAMHAQARPKAED